MALREVLARFTFQVDDSRLKSAAKQTDGLVDKMRDFVGVVAGSAFVLGIKNAVVDFVKMGDELNDTSKILGVSTDELQRWRVAAGFSGVSADNLTAGLRALSRNAFAAAEGGGEAGATFKKLGLEVKNADGTLKDTTVLLRDAGIALSGVESSTEKVALAQKILGKSGAALIPLFEGGAEGLDELLAKLDEFGGGIGKDAVKMAAEADDRFGEWDLAMLSLKSRLAVSVLPALTSFVARSSRVLVSLGKLIESTDIVQASMIVLGAVAARTAIMILAKWGPVILRFGAWAVVLAVAALAIEDVIGFMRGADSVTGRWLKKLFEFGEIGDTIDEFRKRLKEAGSVGEVVAEIFSTLGSAMVGSFANLADQIGASGVFDNIGSDAAYALINGLLMGLPEFLYSYIPQLNALWTDTFGEFDWWDVGESAAKGIINGLTGGLTEAVPALIDLAGTLGNAIKDGLDISLDANSPPREMIKRGRDIGEALRMGQEMMLPALNRMANRTASVMMPAPSGGGGGRRSFDQRNQITNNFYGAATVDTVRQGTALGLADAAKRGNQLAAESLG